MEEEKEITQSEVIEYLKSRRGEKFTAKELQVRLDLRSGIYENLKRLRPNCNWCGDPVFGDPKLCPWCGGLLVLNEDVRCVKAYSRKDSREQVFFYWIK